MSNRIVLTKGNLNVDVMVQEGNIVIKVLELLLNLEGVTKEEIKVEKSKPNNKPKEDKVSTKPVKKTPPIWIVECEECNDFVTLNKLKNEGDVFKCKKCEGKTNLSDDNTVITNYTCECGTPHTVTIHSLASVINTKCRKCSNPIDLKWNEKKEMYYRL